MIPEGAEALAAAGAPAPSPLGQPVVTPGAPEVIDADTVRVRLEPATDEPPHRATMTLLNFPEKTFPGY